MTHRSRRELERALDDLAGRHGDAAEEQVTLRRAIIDTDGRVIDAQERVFEV